MFNNPSKNKCYQISTQTYNKCDLFLCIVNTINYKLYPHNNVTIIANIYQIYCFNVILFQQKFN